MQVTFLLAGARERSQLLDLLTEGLANDVSLQADGWGQVSPDDDARPG
jgi:hypothetical protein